MEIARGYVLTKKKKKKKKKGLRGPDAWSLGEIPLLISSRAETVREEKARGITGPRPQEDEKVNFGTPAAQTFERGIPADHVSQYLRATAKRS